MRKGIFRFAAVLAHAAVNAASRKRRYTARFDPLLWMFAAAAGSTSLCLAQAPASANVAAAATNPAKKVAIAKDYGKLPLSFESNHGQTDPRVRFLSRGNGYSLFLTDSAAVLSLRKPEAAPSAGSGLKAGFPQGLAPKQPASFKTDVVRMELAGASRTLHVAGDSQLPGTANYFIGNDPAKWHSGVPTYASVKYGQVYPGVDLVYYGNQSQLEYDFVVAPHADPKPIKLHFVGAKKLKLDSNGDLEVIAKNGQIAFHKPVVYQEIAGKREEVEGSFSLTAKNSVTFSLGAYDHAKEVVIDPTLAYSTYLGGSNGASGGAIAVDASGNAYVTGITASSDFPITPGAFQTANKNKVPVYNTPIAIAYVTKLNPAGSALIYSTYLGGSTGVDGGNSIAVDLSGNAYVTGAASSKDFPVTPGAFQTVNKSKVALADNAFVTKLNADGSSLVYSTFLGGSGTAPLGDGARGIAVDASGNAYVTGEAVSTDFPVTPGAFQTVNRGAANQGTNAFVTGLNATGSALIYSTYLGGSGIAGEDYGGDAANGIAVDKSGYAYVTGVTGSTDFPVTPGAFHTVPDVVAGFVTKLNPSGTALAYSTYLAADCSSIALDGSGNVYVTGAAAGPYFPVTPGAFQTVSNGGSNAANAFVSKLNAAGSALVYSTYLGGSGGLNALTGDFFGDWGYGIAVDASGNAYVTGITFSPDFPVTSGAFQTTNNGTENEVTNAFLTGLNPDGSALVYSTYLGGRGIVNAPPESYWVGDAGVGVAVDSSGGVYLTGEASSLNFPVTVGAFQTTNIGSEQGEPTSFVAKFSVGAGKSPTPTATSTALASDGNPQKLGVKVTFTAYVQPSSGRGIPTGTVTFAIDGGQGTVVTLDDTGHASYATSTLTVGSHAIKASYSGDSNYTASSATLTQVITAVAQCTNTINHASGFAGGGLTLNGGAAISGSALQLTDGGTYEVRSAFYPAAVPIDNFVTDFTFQLTNAQADGFTFVVQTNSPQALGGGGPGLGYVGIPSSAALKFDLYNNAGEGTSSTGFYLDGTYPTKPSFDLLSKGIDLHSGHIFAAHLVYNGTLVTATITDTVTQASVTLTDRIPPKAPGGLAYLGFTGATGKFSATQNILTWTYSSTIPCPVQ